MYRRVLGKRHHSQAAAAEPGATAQKRNRLFSGAQFRLVIELRGHTSPS